MLPKVCVQIDASFRTKSQNLWIVMFNLQLQLFEKSTRSHTHRHANTHTYSRNVPNNQAKQMLANRFFFLFIIPYHFVDISHSPVSVLVATTQIGAVACSVYSVCVCGFCVCAREYLHRGKIKPNKTAREKNREYSHSYLFSITPPIADRALPLVRSLCVLYTSVCALCVIPDVNASYYVSPSLYSREFIHS